MQVSVRLGTGLRGLSGAPFLALDLEEGATIEELYAQLARAEPEMAPALRSALAIVGGQQASRDQVLRHRQEVALLLPMSGG